jgi:hypothetical protein
MTNRKGIRIGYTVAAFAILIAEVLIALYVRDAFVRPYGGDILVTLLICCILRVVWPRKYRLPIAGGVLTFAVLVEVGQYFGLVYLLGLGHIAFFRILIGTGFSWWDMLCYAAGCGIFAAIDCGITAHRRS